MSKVKLLGGLALLAVVIGVIFFISKGGNTSSSNSDAVAIVNGESISRSEYDLRLAQISKQYEGQEVDTAALGQEVVEQMVSETLLLQETANRGITVSQEEIDAEYQTIAATFGTPEEFEQTLKTENLTADQLKENIAKQTKVDKYVDQIKAERNIQVTEEEIKASYDESMAGSEEGPKLEEVRDQVEQQVLQQKIGVIMQEIIAGLREKADIQILL